MESTTATVAEIRRPAISTSYLAVLRALEREQNAELRDPVLEERRRRIRKISLSFRPARACTVAPRPQIFHDFMMTGGKEERVRPATTGQRFCTTLRQCADWDGNRHRLVPSESGREERRCQSHSRTSRSKMSKTQYCGDVGKIRARLRSGNDAAANLKGSMSRPYYAYCRPCNERNSKFFEAYHENPNAKAQRKLREEWSKDFVADF